MNKNRFLNGLLVVLFLVAAGTKDGYCQVMNGNYNANFFWSGQPAITLPAIDTTSFTTEEKIKLKSLLDMFAESTMFTDDDCYENSYFWYPAYFFGATESEFMVWLQNHADSSYKENGFIVWRESLPFGGNETRYAIHLDSLIYEERWYIDGEDNPFFNEVGNNLWGINRVTFKRLGEYILPEIDMNIYYEDMFEIMKEDPEYAFLSGVICETKMAYTYLYYELLDDDDNNKLLAKKGNESLYKDCMGYTGIKGIKKADMKIYPNPAKEQITVNLPSEMNENVDIKIFNTLGVNVLSQHNVNGGQIDMNISGLPTGTYVVRCIKNNKVISKIFVKQ